MDFLKLIEVLTTLQAAIEENTLAIGKNNQAQQLNFETMIIGLEIIEAELAHNIGETQRGRTKEHRKDVLIKVRRALDILKGKTC